MKHLIVAPDITIKQALKRLNKSGEKCLIVTDNNKFLLGTLSDGDLRKAILNEKNINDSINEIYNSHSTFLKQNKYSHQEVRNIFLKEKYDLIPVINKKGKVVEILTWSQTFKNESEQKVKPLNVPVVIMAGGKGTRLQPFTMILPKPLIPIHEKTIIEHIIDRFVQLGCNEYHLTINYKSRILKAYFEELQPRYQVHYVEENKPLGTAGSLCVFHKIFNNPFFVTNCDTIIKTDYQDLYNYHRKEKNDITLVASTKEYIIPYGTCELNGEGLLSFINEKPKQNFLVNTGLYVINPSVLTIIPENSLFNFTQLIKSVCDQKGRVGVFPIDDDAWIDVGQWTEYENAIDKL